MKKEYEQPRLEVAEFQFTEHIACSGEGNGNGNNGNGIERGR